MEVENTVTRDTLSVLFKEKIPRNAMNYYKKLYIQKHLVHNEKHTNSPILIEATRAWTHLTKEEKSVIKKEYDKLVLSHKRMYAEGLKNIEPYCKKKRVIPASKTTPADDFVNKSDIIQETLSESPVLYPQLPPVSQDHVTPENNTTDSHKLSESDHSHLIVNVPEPVPPKFRFAQELFVMIQGLDANLSTLSWATMMSIQKRRYQTALSVIKTQYINNYIKYLESLSSHQLYKLLNPIDVI